jgi:hypothetical protein
MNEGVILGAISGTTILAVLTVALLDRAQRRRDHR